MKYCIQSGIYSAFQSSPVCSVFVFGVSIPWSSWTIQYDPTQERYMAHLEQFELKIQFSLSTGESFHLMDIFCSSQRKKRRRKRRRLATCLHLHKCSAAQSAGKNDFQAETLFFPSYAWTRHENKPRAKQINKSVAASSMTNPVLALRRATFEGARPPTF